MYCFVLLLVSLLATGTPACVSGSGEDIRTVIITAFVDEDDFNNSSRIETVKGAVALSSWVFQKEFRVAFELREVTVWHYPTEQDKLDLDAADLHFKLLAENIDTDIVLAFTSKSMDRYAMAEIDGNWEETRQEVLGIASGSGSGRTAFVRITEQVGFTTLHELLHLFGASDVVGGFEETVMRYPTTSKIDSKNTATVLANRKRTFNKK